MSLVKEISNKNTIKQTGKKTNKQKLNTRQKQKQNEEIFDKVFY